MASCEKCWSDAGWMALSVGDKSQSEYYRELISSRTDICTPEDRAGKDAEFCPNCKRNTIHQIIRKCIICNYDIKMSYAIEQPDDDTPMWKMELLRASHDYAHEKCPNEKLGRMSGDDSPLREIEKVQKAFYDGFISGRGETAADVIKSAKECPHNFKMMTHFGTMCMCCGKLLESF